MTGVQTCALPIYEEFMKQKLYEFRGCKVLLDADLAEVYGYELKAFNQQVKRNIQLHYQIIETSYHSEIFLYFFLPAD